MAVIDFYLGGRFCGYLKDGVYITERWVKQHFYVKGRGYPISLSILKKLKEHGCHTVLVREHGKSVKTYTAPLSAYLDAVLIQEPPFDQQRCLPLKSMTLVGGV